MRAALQPDAKAEEIAGRVRSQLKSLGTTPSSVKTSLVSLSVEELLARSIKPRQMLLDPILPTQGLAMLYSYRGTGKTFLALGIGDAVATGGSFLRWTPSPRKTLYVDGEPPAKTVQERPAMILAGMEGREPSPGAFCVVTPDRTRASGVAASTGVGA